MNILQQHKERIEKLTCVTYIADALYAISGGALSSRLYEMIDDSKPPEMSGEQARNNVLSEFEKLGGEVIYGD